MAAGTQRTANRAVWRSPQPRQVEGRAGADPDAANAPPRLSLMRQPVALHHASRLVNHGPTVLVTTAHGGRRNVMAAAWSMPVEFTPPRIAVVVDKKTFTSDLLKASDRFALSLARAV